MVPRVVIWARYLWPVDFSEWAACGRNRATPIADFTPGSPMANRIRPVEEKVQSILVAFEQINVAAAACEAGVPASTMRYDLNKVKALLPVVPANQKPGPKPRQESDVPTPEMK